MSTVRLGKSEIISPKNGFAEYEVELAKYKSEI